MFLVEVDDLRGSLVVTANGDHPGLVHAVYGVRVPHVARGVHSNALGGCLLVWCIIFLETHLSVACYVAL